MSEETPKPKQASISKQWILGLTAAFLTLSFGGLAVAKHHGHHHGHHKSKMKLLKQADTNKDGIITKEELNTAQQNKFKSFDADNNGEVTKEEILKSFTQHYEPMATRLTRNFDLNQDGKVSAEEFKKHVDHKLYMLDLNNDGQISQDELPRRMQKGKHHSKHCPKHKGEHRGSHSQEHRGSHSESKN